MKRIGLATPTFNSELWIYPFLKLTEGLDRRVLLQGERPIDGYVKEYGVVSEPDRSEALVRKYFPDVEIIPHSVYKFCPDFWNKGHEYLKNDCDFILRFDTDEMIEPSHWKELLRFLKEVDHLDALGIDFGQAIMYGKDLQNGFQNPNNSWIETRGLHKNHIYQNSGEFPGPKHIANWPLGALHHYKGMKLESITEKGEYKTPEWLRKLFEEGWKLLETV